MSDTLNTVILGIIEGITEFLPISSTGHLLIAEQWLGERSELFNVAIQSGAILAIVLIYWRRLLNLLTRFEEPAHRDYLAKLTVAFLITAAGAFLATRLGWKLPESVVPVALATLIGGILILVIERYVAGKPASATVTWNVAFWVGLCQILAPVFPGASRSGCTIFAA
ncbi:MAG: undecaprenyl-diphosphatase, partial [Gammaproteobacteria bacterium]